MAQTHCTSAIDALHDVFLAHAAALARNGDHDAAAALLEDWLASGAVTADAFDLLAQVRAQQGKLDDAERLWQRAAELAPASYKYADALRLVRRLKARPRWLRRPGALVGGLALAAGLVFVVIRPSPSRKAASILRADATADSTAQSTRPSVRSIAAQCRTRPSLTPVAGLRQDTTDTTALVLVPQEGLFRHGTVLRPGARALLQRLGLALAPLANDVTIRLTGHADDRLPRPDLRQMGLDNDELGLRRAVVAARVLRSVSGIAITRFDLRSRGAAQPPFVNATPGGRARNRTVVIELVASHPAAGCGERP